MYSWDYEYFLLTQAILELVEKRMRPDAQARFLSALDAEVERLRCSYAALE